MILFPDDKTLLTAFQNGEPSAEKAVFDRFFQPLCLFSERITNNLPQSEDIVVEALQKCLLRREDFEALAKLKSFLYQVVHNASINQAIARQRQQGAHEMMRHLIQEKAEIDFPFESEILLAELLQEIYAEIGNLPDKCGQIFKMIFLQELSTDEIASRLGINVQTVRSQKARAIQLIRTALLKKNRMRTALLLMALTRFYPHR